MTVLLDRRQTPGLQRWILLAITMAALQLSGCISVETQVYANGYVHRSIIVEAPAKHSEAGRKAVEGVIGSNWKSSERDEGARHLLVFERGFWASEPDRPFQSIRFRKTQEWLLPVSTCEFSETINLKDYFSSQREAKEAAETQVTYRLTMPGEIIKTNGGDRDPAALPFLGSRATWTGNLDQEIQISAESRQIRLWWLGFELLVVFLIIRGINRMLNWWARRSAEKATA